MVTRRRIREVGGVYHVFNRGVLRQTIFHDDEDRLYFLWLLEECADRFGVEFCAYCLMTNHFHLHLCTPDANIPEAMHWLFTCFALRFNAKYQQTGHVLETRYKSPLVEPGRSQVVVTRYLHRNPVEAGMVQHPSQYPWSSYRYYAHPDDCPKWLHPSRILKLIHPIQEAAVSTYLEFVANGHPGDELLDRVLSNDTAIGSPAFLLRLAEEQGLPAGDILSTEEVLSAVCRAFYCSRQNLFAGTRPKPRPLLAAALLLSRMTTLNADEIGDRLGGRNARSVHRDLKDAKILIATDADFRDRLDRCLTEGDTGTILRSI